MAVKEQKGSFLLSRDPSYVQRRSQEIMQQLQENQAGQPAPATPAGGMQVPPEFATQPDGAIIEDGDTGRRYQKRGNVMVPMQ
jgi:hypothetical protein